jgi:Tfp pilus assembly protein PilF
VADQYRIDELRRRVDLEPTSIAFAQLAEEYRRVGQPRDAIATCRAGLAIHPGYASARLTLARALAQIGELQAAQEELQQLLSTSPQNLSAIRTLAAVLQKRGATAEALAQYRAAFAIAPNDPDLERTIDELARLLERAAGATPRDQADRQIAALEQFLTAVHVTRAQLGA